MAFPASSAARDIRVMVVDDSAFMRLAIEKLLKQTPGIIVVGSARDGVEAVQRALELRPDVITMDVEMPRLDGVSAVAEIMKTVPTPVIMLSTLTSQGADTTIRALEAGAVGCVAKPSAKSQDLQGVGEHLRAAVLGAREARLRRHRPAPALPARPTVTKGPVATAPSPSIIVIGSSTGGPPALTEVVPHLSASCRAGVVVVQHMPAGFTNALARRLDSLSHLTVREAVEGDAIAAGVVLVAPGDYHLTVTPERRVHLDQGPTLHGVRPSVDIALDSVAEVYGKHAAVAILTGMGRDGGAGCARAEAAGARIITQDEATSVVYGMPRVAKELTAHAQVLPVDRIADALVGAIATR